MAIGDDAAISPGSLQAVEADQVTNILAGDRIIMAVSDADVDLEGVSRPLLAKAFILRISEAITVYREDRTPRKLLTNTAYALGATAVLGIVLVLMRRLFRRLDAVAEKRLKSKMEGLRIQTFQIVQTELLWKSTAHRLPHRSYARDSGVFCPCMRRSSWVSIPGRVRPPNACCSCCWIRCAQWLWPSSRCCPISFFWQSCSWWCAI